MPQWVRVVVVVEGLRMLVQLTYLLCSSRFKSLKPGWVPQVPCSSEKGWGSCPVKPDFMKRSSASEPRKKEEG